MGPGGENDGAGERTNAWLIEKRWGQCVAVFAEPVEVASELVRERDNAARRAARFAARGVLFDVVSRVRSPGGDLA